MATASIAVCQYLGILKGEHCGLLPTLGCDGEEWGIKGGRILIHEATPP